MRHYVDGIRQGVLATLILMIITDIPGASMSKIETGDDSIDGRDRGQWTDTHVFHLP